MKKLLPLTGIAAFLCVLAAHLQHGDVPGNNASLATITQFYQTHATNSVILATLIAYAAFFLIIFAGYLLALFHRHGTRGKFAAYVGFAGAILFADGLIFTALFSFILGNATSALTPSSMQVLHELFYYTFGPVDVASAVFLAGYGLATLKTTVLPKWLGWLALTFALISLLPHPIGDYAGFVGLGLWLVITSILLTLKKDATAKNNS